jgi:cobalt-zinc-cadmium efflux system membrane fusion protein
MLNSSHRQPSSVSLSITCNQLTRSRVKPGNLVTVTAAGRQATAKVSFVSPALDAQTRLVPVIAIDVGYGMAGWASR